jgi:hypothetical protein
LWIGRIFSVKSSLGYPLTGNDEVKRAKYVHVRVPFSSILTPRFVRWQNSDVDSEYECLKSIWVVRLHEVTFTSGGPILKIRACETLLTWRNERFAAKMWKHPTQKDPNTKESVYLPPLKPSDSERRWYDIEKNGKIVKAKKGGEDVIRGVTLEAPRRHKRVRKENDQGRKREAWEAVNYSTKVIFRRLSYN